MSAKSSLAGTNLRTFSSAFLIAASLLTVLPASSARAQDKSVTFDFSLSYRTHYQNNIPSPLTVQRRGRCSINNASNQVSYNLIQDDINYYLSARITSVFFYRIDGGVGFDCSVLLEGTHQELFITALTYDPASGQIMAALFPNNSGAQPFTESAYLWYVDTSKPGHFVYHFRGNDELFSLAQQTWGVNFTRVELLFDVQAPS